MHRRNGRMSSSFSRENKARAGFLRARRARLRSRLHQYFPGVLSDRPEDSVIIVCPPNARGMDSARSLHCPAFTGDKAASIKKGKRERERERRARADAPISLGFRSCVSSRSSQRISGMQDPRSGCDELAAAETRGRD